MMGLAMVNSKNGSDQLAMGAATAAVCIAQTLHELDARILPRLRANVDDWYQTLSDRGDHDAAKVVYMFARALRDHEIFPNP
jgi:hypothetical protein